MNKSEVYFILLYIAIRDPQISLKNHCEARSLETLAFVSKLRLMEPTRAERKNPWKKHMKVVGRTEIYQTRKHNDLSHETESPVLSWCVQWDSQWNAIFLVTPIPSMSWVPSRNQTWRWNVLLNVAFFNGKII